MRALRASTVALPIALVALIACGDDTTPGSGGSGGEAASTTSSTGAPTTAASGSTGGQGGDGGDGSGGSASGGGGAAPVELCGDAVTAADLEGGSWDTRFTISGFTGPDGFAPAVHDFAVDTDGSIVAAGRFGYFEGEPVPPLMRLRDGAWEPARETWELPAPLDGFSAIAIGPDGELALALNDSFGERDGEIWLDTGDGLESIGAYTGQVRSLAWFEGRLWVAGSFQLEQAEGANLVSWDGDGWSDAPGGKTDGPVYELTVSGDELLVGGAFTEVGGTDALDVATFDGEAFTPYDFDALGIFALARDDEGELYAGGAFGDFDGAAGLARWTEDGWEVVGGGLGQYQTRGVVTDLSIHDGIIDVTGCFNTAGGLEDADGTIASRSFARWTGTEWESLDDGGAGASSPWFAPLACGDEGPLAIWDATNQRLVHAGGQLLAGGFFAGAGGVQSQSILARDDDASEWSAQGASGFGIGGSLDRIAAGGEGCEVYGLGLFSHAGGEAVDARVVHWEGDGWRALPDPLPAGGDVYCASMDVSPSGEVAVGCLIFDGDTTRGAILRREGDAMVEMPLGELPSIFVVKWSRDGELYVGGGSGGGFVGRVDGDELTVIGDAFDGQVDQLVISADGKLVVAGFFLNVGDVPARQIAIGDESGWAPLGDGLPSQALALTRDGDDVYASSYDQGSGTYLLGRFRLDVEGAEWEELASDAGATPLGDYSFNALHVVDGEILAAGTVEMDDGSGRGIVVYRDGEFHPLAGGVGAIGVSSVAIANDAIWVGGVIGQAGAGEGLVSSVGVARYVIASD